VRRRSGAFYGRAMRAGHIYTAAGDGQPGLSGNSGPAVHGSIFPGPITVDGFVNIVILDNRTVLWRPRRS
jgi:hypothetical protein